MLYLTRALLVLVVTIPATAQTPCFETALGANLQLGDDQVAQNRALGFAFPFAGRSVSAVDVSSNGFVWLGSNSDSACCDGNASAFLANTARLAAAWVDLNPAAGGAVHFATFPGRAVITWAQVPEYGHNDPLTIQLQMHADGSFQLLWQSPLTIQSHTTLVGITPGGGATNPRVIDFSSALPFNSGTSATVYELFGANTIDLGGRVITFTPNGQGGYTVTRRTDCRFGGFVGNGIGCPPSLPVTLIASVVSRPVIGANFDMIVGEAPATATAGVMGYGVAANTSLAPIGMTSCTLYSSLAMTIPFTVQGRFSVVTLAIPNEMGLVGAGFSAQAFLIAPGANPAGIVASNGGDVVIGT
jgi:hypothetical protein